MIHDYIAVVYHAAVFSTNTGTFVYQ